MNQNTSKVIAICSKCNNPYFCGENCNHCVKDDVDALKIAKYAAAMKEAVNCWQNGDCDEHTIVCKPKVKEFAIKIYELQQHINKLESSIKDHRNSKKQADDYDKKLWECV